MYAMGKIKISYLSVQGKKTIRFTSKKEKDVREKLSDGISIYNTNTRKNSPQKKNLK